MFKVISDIMAQWYIMEIAFLITMNFYNAKKMNCALMFIISIHYSRIALSNLVQLESCNDVISDIMA